MRLYETVFILKPDLSEEENQGWIQRIVQVIEQNKGELIRLDEWGTKTLAYKINKFNKGYYSYAVFLGDDTCVRELDRHFKMLDPIIRHIIVKLDERELEKHRKAQLDKVASEGAVQEGSVEHAEGSGDPYEPELDDSMVSETKSTGEVTA